MTDLDRRGLLVTAGIVSVIVSTGAVSACSPADTAVTQLPAKFFAKVAVGRLVEAKAELTTTVTLSLVTSEGAQLFKGPYEVAEAVHRLLNAEGFSMIGDTQDNAVGGFYWASMGPWLCSDMVKGEVPQLTIDNCQGGLMDPVLNVFVGLQGSSAISRMLILENRRLSGQMTTDYPPPPIEK